MELPQELNSLLSQPYCISLFGQVLFFGSCSQPAIIAAIADTLLHTATTSCILHLRVLSILTTLSGPVCGNSPASLGWHFSFKNPTGNGSSRCFRLHNFRFALCELFQSLLSVLHIICDRQGKSIASIATRWVLDHPFVGAVMISTYFLSLTLLFLDVGASLNIRTETKAYMGST